MAIPTFLPPALKTPPAVPGAARLTGALAAMLSDPVVAVVRDAKELDDALVSRVSAIEFRAGDLRTLPREVARAREAGKAVFLYPELISGLGRDPAAIEFLCGYARPNVVVSTKKQILQKARACGLTTIFQIFMIDTQAFETGIQAAAKTDCDAVEIMPGAIPHIVREVCGLIELPVLCAGLVKTTAEIEVLLAAGASAVATSRRPLWFMNPASSEGGAAA